MGLYVTTTAPLSSVMICWNTVPSTLNLSFRDELSTLGAWPDLVLFVGCAIREAVHSFLPVGRLDCCWLSPTVIPGFSLLEIHDKNFCSRLDIYLFKNGASPSTKEVSVFLYRR
jgi:hypothetical protein